VADEQDFAKRIGLTRGKMVLIGILAVTLLGVVYVQYGSDSSEDVVAAVDPTVGTPPPPPAEAQSSNPAPESPVAAAPAPTDESSAAMSQSFDAARWNKSDLETTVQHDPFALPSGFPRPVQMVNGQGVAGDGTAGSDAATSASQLADEVAKLHTQLEELRQRGVSVIVREHDQYVAMIGDRTVHVGDEINGFTVTAIEPDGVRVEKKVQQ
jgi:hypothetical protein